MQIVVDQLVTTYQLTGSGKVVVLLHGWGDSSKGLAALQAELAKHYQVLALDLPGFGGTQSPATAWGLSDYSLFVAAVLTKLKLKSYAIVGHSNGGAIAIRGVAQGVLKPDRLVLLASSGIRSQYNGRKKAMRLAAKGAKTLTKPLPKSIQRRLRTKAYATIGSDMLVAEHLQETFKRIVNDDVQADAARVQQHTLLIYGDDDTATPVAYGELLQSEIGFSDLHVLPDAGHFIHLDQPRIVASLIQEFLA
ncbi:MAG: alpha/beta hydrolase [Candidatus Saccharimonadales bacterium]